LNQKVLSLDLKTDRESLMRIACGSEFQTDGAEDRKARHKAPEVYSSLPKEE